MEQVVEEEVEEMEPMDLKSYFDTVNINLDDSVLSRCNELCDKYQIDPEDFFDMWLAYTSSHLNGAPPSLDALDRMERKELQKKYKSTPKAKHTQIPIETTPAKPSIKQEFKQESPLLSPSVSQLMDSQSSQDSPSQLFAQRTDSRAVLYEFGESTPESFKECTDNKLVVKIEKEGCANSRYMFEKFLTRRESLNAVTHFVVDDIITYYKLELTEKKLDEYGEMIICGRVYSNIPGKLNLQTLFIEGGLDLYRGDTIELNVDKIKKVALFSGQIVVLKGSGMRKMFVATEIYCGAPLPQPEKPISIPETVQIVIGAGPFTLADNLLYEPLEDLLKYVSEMKPNILILMGPFMESTHTILEDLNETYENFFEDIIDGIMQRLKGINVQVILIPSPKEIHHHIIFPTPSYKLRKKYENLITAPNPCILDINGLLIGASTVDVLFHLGKSEIFKDQEYSMKNDKMSRLISHIFDQRSFYPLHPPDLDARVDYSLLEKSGVIEYLPHLMILPSNFRYFVKKIQGSIIINPERLIKGQVAGTFARVEVRTGPEPIYERISCQILRV